LIAEEIRNIKCDLNTYRSSDDITAAECPLVPSQIKQSSVGQCIVQAARPHGVLSPILLGLSVKLEHVFASKFLLTHLARLGAHCIPRTVATGRVSYVCDWLSNSTGLDSGDRSWICNAA